MCVSRCLHKECVSRGPRAASESEESGERRETEREERERDRAPESGRAPAQCNHMMTLFVRGDAAVARGAPSRAPREWNGESAGEGEPNANRSSRAKSQLGPRGSRGRSALQKKKKN